MKRKLPYLAFAAVSIILAAAMLFFIPVPGSTRGRSENAAGMGPEQAAEPRQLMAPQSMGALQSSFREVAKKALPVVVEINVTETITRRVPRLDFPFPFPFDQSPNGGGVEPRPRGGGGERTFKQSALGSGIIVRHIGDRYYVITNNHVVDKATDISVRLNNQRVFESKIVGVDARKDIAMISFQSREEIPVAALGDSSSLQVGDIVFAVGNPFGFESTVTMGIVSALGRRGPADGASTYTDYIQTDAAINQGNSGGALMDVNGRVVGINAWIAAPTGGNIGLGFAIPIDNALKDIEAFISTGKVAYGWLGAEIADIQDNSTYPGFAADLKVAGVKGAIVLNVYKGSPADKAGLLPGDYITRVNATDAENSAQLTQAVGNLEAGKSFDFRLIRGGEKMKLSVTIGVRDENDKVAQYRNLWPGMTVLDITDQIRQEANIPRGVRGVVVGYIPDRSTPASIVGFQPSDVITAINDRPVRNLMDYFKALNDGSKKEVSFRIVRQGTEVTAGLLR